MLAPFLYFKLLLFLNTEVFTILNIKNKFTIAFKFEWATYESK